MITIVKTILRIIAGTAGGRRLKSPKGQKIRPTSDRVREALFSLLLARYGFPENTQVLDLFAGTGALGLEALSRGAKSAIFVENDKQASALIRENAKSLAFTHARIFCLDSTHFLQNAQGKNFDLVFLDPPYENNLISPVLSLLPPVLSTGAVVIAEHAAKEQSPVAPEGLLQVETRIYGTAALTLFEQKTRS